ncbi:hypothetical protein CSUI_009678 [Cystoisospora suis]|uniref:Uncharacterized protein n=1 Tax=Cystoisospora suis TaxID=483139 RepID=A0A2C6KJG5_9APIC|nr:hypothetical protein CSUI_009678 [Cystoisospora suis]
MEKFLQDFEQGQATQEPLFFPPTDPLPAPETATEAPHQKRTAISEATTRSGPVVEPSPTAPATFLPAPVPTTNSEGPPQAKKPKPSSETTGGGPTTEVFSSTSAPPAAETTDGLRKGEVSVAAPRRQETSTGAREGQKGEREQTRRFLPLRGLPPDSTIPVSQIIAEFIARHFPHVSRPTSGGTSPAEESRSPDFQEKPAALKEQTSS